jgi:hypothetical protein
VTPFTHGIVYTRKADGGVTVCRPTWWALGYMTGGGGLWDDKPRGFMAELVRRKTCPELQKGNAITEDAAWTFVNAMQWGGCSTAEAWNVIRLHDCDRFGYDAQVIRHDELPDRWFRDAWTRKGSNSGLPRVDMEAARLIQWERLHDAVSRENARRAAALFGKPEIKLNKAEFQTAITNARDEDELRRVWLPELRQPGVYPPFPQAQ